MRVYERGPDGTFADLPREIEGMSQVLTVTGRNFTLSLRFADIYKGIA